MHGARGGGYGLVARPKRLADRALTQTSATSSPKRAQAYPAQAVPCSALAAPQIQLHPAERAEPGASGRHPETPRDASIDRVTRPRQRRAMPPRRSPDLPRCRMTMQAPPQAPVHRGAVRARAIQPGGAPAETSRGQLLGVLRHDADRLAHGPPGWLHRHQFSTSAGAARALLPAQRVESCRGSEGRLVLPYHWLKLITKVNPALNLPLN